MFRKPNNLLCDILIRILFFLLTAALIALFQLIIDLILFIPWIKDISDSIDYSASSNMIGISFTLLSVSITCRSFLLGRYSSNYRGFSMKIIIEKSTNYISKTLWYIVLCCPFYSLIIYSFGFKRRLYALTLLSGLCVIGYFVTVLFRLSKENIRKTIEYIIIDSFFDQNSQFSAEYRKELLKRLVFGDIYQLESQLSFIELLNLLTDVLTCKDNYIYKKRFFLLKSYVQYDIYNKVKNLSYAEKSEKIKEFSIYAYQYYTYIIDNHKESRNEELLVQFNEIINQFITHSGINIETYSEFIRDIKHDNDYVSTIYTLFFNIVFGLFCASSLKLSLNDIDYLRELLINTSRNKHLLLSDSKIDIIVLNAVFYAINNDSLPDKNSVKDIYNYIDDLFYSTSSLDMDFFIRTIYLDFTAFDYYNYLKSSIPIDLNNRKKKYIFNVESEDSNE